MLGAEDVKKIQAETVATQPQTENSENAKPFEGPSETPEIPFQLAQLKLAELFGVSSVEMSQFDTEFKRLLDYVDTFNPKSLDDIIYHVKHLDSQIGTVMGENKLKTLSRYLFLTREKDYIEKQMERMKGL